MYKFVAPLYLVLAKKPGGKKYHINLNQYRNWHFHVSNSLKTQYSEVMSHQLYGLKFRGPITLEFILYRPDKRRVDRSNILCIHEKFFCDALTTNGCIVDDNDNYIIQTTYSTGDIDKHNPRVEIIVRDRG